MRFKTPSAASIVSCIFAPLFFSASFHQTTPFASESAIHPIPSDTVTAMAFCTAATAALLFAANTPEVRP